MNRITLRYLSSKYCWCCKTFQRAGALSNHVCQLRPDQVSQLFTRNLNNSPDNTAAVLTSFKTLSLYEPPEEQDDRDVEELPLYGESADVESPPADKSADPEGQEASILPVSTRADLLVVRTQRFIYENSSNWNPFAPFENA